MATTSVDATTVTFWQGAPTAVSHSSQAPLAPNAAFRFESNAQLRLGRSQERRLRDAHLMTVQKNVILVTPVHRIGHFPDTSSSIPFPGRPGIALAVPGHVFLGALGFPGLPEGVVAIEL